MRSSRSSSKISLGRSNVTANFLRVVAVIAMISINAVAWSQSFVIGDLTYSVLANNTVSVSGCSSTASSVTIPEIVSYDNKEYTVTTIGTKAFQYKWDLRSVTFPSSLTTIGSYAFNYCKKLSVIGWSSNIQFIGEYAFAECGGLDTSTGEIVGFTEITLPNNLKEISAHLFDGCSFLEKITLPTNLSVIRSGAFNHCGKLKEIVIPEGVTKIEYSAFSYCYDLSSVHFPNSLESIGGGAFGNCSSLTDIYSDIIDPNRCNVGAGNISNAFSSNTSAGNIFDFKKCTLHVPVGCIEKYRALGVWSNFSNIVEIATEGPLASFSMADASMRMGETLTLPVSMNNSVEITSFQCDIHLPAGFEAVKNAKGKPQVKLSARKSTTHTISANVVAEGVVRVACLSLDNSTFSDTEGALFTIDIQPINADAGVHEISIDNILAGKPDGKGVDIEPAKCSITLRKALMPGDVNDDDVVNVSDAIATVSYILGNSAEGYLLENADINGDGIINILDATEIIRIVLGTNQPAQAPAAVRVQKQNAVSDVATEALYVDNFEIKSGEEKLLPVKLKANRDYTGFQTDIYLPEGLEVVNVKKGNATTPDVTLNEECNSGTHILSSAIQKDGALRVISISLENDMYGQSADNTLFTVRVRVNPEFTSSGISPIYFRKTLFNTGTEESHFADSASEIGINNTPTGVADVIKDDLSKQYFNLQGMPVKNPVKGMIYILRTATSAEKVVF